MNEAFFTTQRQQMVTEIAAHASVSAPYIGKPVLDTRVLRVMADVPRHEFVPVELKAYAYADTPLPIGYDKTISQPFIVALMTDLLDLKDTDVVLEIGTGLGYQAAVLARLALKVYTVDIIEELSRQAQRRLERLHYVNIEMRTANGYFGWPEAAPFDKIVVTAAPDLIPTPLLQQLKAGGKLVLPAGLRDSQKLMLVRKDERGGISTAEVLPVRFGELESPQDARLC